MPQNCTYIQYFSFFPGSTQCGHLCWALGAQIFPFGINNVPTVCICLFSLCSLSNLSINNVTAAETHLAPYWEGRGWEQLEGHQLHCFHCSPCHRYHHCCRCRKKMCETNLIPWWLFDIMSLLSRVSFCDNISVTEATDSQVCVVWHVHTWILDTNRRAHCYIRSYTV